MSDDLANLDAIAQAQLIRDREVTPLELVDAAIARIEQVNPKLNAVIIPRFEKAREEARRVTKFDAPFAGVPFLLKDLVCASQGDPLHDGMRALRAVNNVAPADTYLAAKFRAAGFIFLGKTNTPELGLNVTTEPDAYGPTRNPWSPEHSTGGSSGGSAAAVASRMVAVAHANDGGGSIRIPASECGLVGLKPSRGRVSLGPEIGDAWHGFAIEGVVSRTVRDTAGVLDAVSGTMPGDPYCAPAKNSSYLEDIRREPGRLRIGVMRRSPAGAPQLHPDCLAAVDEAARALESLGHTVEDSYPQALDEPERGQHILGVIACHTTLSLGQTGLLVGRDLGADDVEFMTWGLAEIGRAMSAESYLTSVAWLQAWTRRIARWWQEGFDLLLTPTILHPPPRLGTLTPSPDNDEEVRKKIFAVVQFTQPYNVTGQPAISLPLSWNGAGLPIGIQLVAEIGGEDLLLRVASQLEQACPWRHRRPALAAIINRSSR